MVDPRNKKGGKSKEKEVGTIYMNNRIENYHINIYPVQKQENM